MLALGYCACYHFKNLNIHNSKFHQNFPTNSVWGLLVETDLTHDEEIEDTQEKVEIQKVQKVENYFLIL